MKEFASARTNEEAIFNNMLRSATNPIECAFGRLKARWQILSFSAADYIVIAVK